MAKLSDPAERSARGNARRRRASSKHARLGCRYAPRPGSRARGSGWMTSPTATRRSKLDLTTRSLQPTQVRMTGILDARRSDRTAIAVKSTVFARLRHQARAAPAEPTRQERPEERPEEHPGRRAASRTGRQGRTDQGRMDQGWTD